MRPFVLLALLVGALLLAPAAWADETAEASYESLDFSGRVVLVLGGEGAGIRPRVASACDGLVRIPTVGKVGSLNVSAAASVLLFAASRVAS